MIAGISRQVAQSARVRSATLAERLALAKKTPGQSAGGKSGQVSGSNTRGDTMPPGPTVPLS